MASQLWTARDARAAAVSAVPLLALLALKPPHKSSHRITSRPVRRPGARQHVCVCAHMRVYVCMLGMGTGWRATSDASSQGSSITFFEAGLSPAHGSPSRLGGFQKSAYLQHRNYLPLCLAFQMWVLGINLGPSHIQEKHFSD